MRHWISSSLVLLAAISVCSGEEENTLWHPSQDPAWELTFEDNFDSEKLDDSHWFPGCRLGRVEYYKRIGYPNARTRGWQPNPPLAHYIIKDGVLNLRVDKDLPKRDKPTSMTVILCEDV